MPKKRELTGQRFGRLVVVKDTRRKNKDHRSLLLCKCDCEREKEISEHQLKQGKTISCGCYTSERLVKQNYKHGAARRNNITSEYYTWRSIRDRCYNPKATGYKNYGGRGIKMYQSWYDSFETFLKDMGPRPFWATSIERKDTNKDYEPDNCVWANDTTQQNNQRSNLRITYNGETLTAKQMWEKHGLGKISYGRFVKRIRQDWPVELALAPPKPLNTFTHNGVTLPTKDIHRRFARKEVCYTTFMARIDRGWSVADALILPLCSFVLST